jgi:NAD(P)-dependent dehydrogenase (short-subunit alcohol dehydrogenase family)
MPNLLKDKVAVVTGAGRGIGRAHAMALAAQGARLVVNDPGVARDGTQGDRSVADGVVAEIEKAGGTAVASYDTVATSEGATRIIQCGIEKFARLDILVNNAGILRDRMIFNMTDEEWDAVIKTHLYGTFYCTREACKIMRQQKSGRIINTSSASGLGNVGQANYSAAKEGIVGFTRTVALEMGSSGVTCNAIRPHAVTRMTLDEKVKASWVKSLGAEEARKKEKRYYEEMSAEGTPPLVVFLCSDAGHNVNGYVFDTMYGRVAIYREPGIQHSVIKAGNWTPEELVELLPKTITKDMVRERPRISVF